MATNIKRGAAEPDTSPPGAHRTLRSGLWLAVLAAIAIVMLRHSLAYVVRPFDPALALRLDPGNAEVAAARSEQLLRNDPAARDEAETLARRALRRSPLSAAGARMLATTRDLAGDTVAARRLMAYSERLSRRDLPTQLWLIETAVARNDIEGALRHYDIALRSTEASKALLFPVLINALAQPAVVHGLIATIAARPAWADAFLEAASRGAADMGGMATLLGGLAKGGYSLPDTVVSQATARLIDAQRFDLAWEVYSASHPAAAHLNLRDPDFSHAGTGASRFEWDIIGGNGLSAEPRLQGSAAGLAYSAATGAGGPVARQLLVLRSGEFELDGRVLERSPGSAAAQVRLTCAQGGQPIVTIAAGSSSFAGHFAIPATCLAQWIEIVVEGGDNPLGASGVIGEIRIHPVAIARQP